jgi:hypothetical protein
MDKITGAEQLQAKLDDYLVGVSLKQKNISLKHYRTPKILFRVLFTKRNVRIR